VALVLIGLLISGGCRKRGERRTVPIRGKLTYSGWLDQKSKHTFRLTFYLQDDPDPLPSHPTTTVRVEKGGEIQEDGAFQVSTYRLNDGLPEGRYKVTVVLQKLKIKMGREEAESKDELDGKYGDPAKTPLEITVTRKGMEPEYLYVER
jgi:hypothetical protein